MNNQHGPSEEYDALRAELLNARKYVFERPLLIITASLAGLKLIEESFVPILPPLAIGLLWFNLWFTLNRMHSMGRLVSYIQLELEEQHFMPWIGWETSLRHHRIWVKSNKSCIKAIIEKNLNEDAAPSAAGYYPPIYLLHVIAVICAFCASIAFVIDIPNTTNSVYALITTIIALPFAFYAIVNRPDQLKFYHEKNRIVWFEVFKYLEEAGIKKRVKKDQ